MRKLFHNASSILTLNTGGRNVKRGSDMSDLGVITKKAIVVENGKIVSFIDEDSIKFSEFDEVIDLKRQLLMPGLIDCHTHTLFAGSRANEFQMKLKGATYEEIAKAGGGIVTTMHAVRNASEDELFELTMERVEHFYTQGITTLEIKSGYGLDYDNELKSLRVINKVARNSPIRILPTFLGAHTIPPEFRHARRNYIKLITDEMIPAIAEKKLAVFCDAFCEKTAFQPDEIEEIFSSASDYGLKLKLHTDQFNSIGGLEVALQNKAVSVDHLEVMPFEKAKLFRNTDTTAVLLPGVSFFLNYDYAPANSLLENNVPFAIATDYNPGSSHIASLLLVMQIAALKMKLTIEQIISAVTINAARALSIENITGSLETGKSADFSVFNTQNYTDLIYTIGKNLCTAAYISGNRVTKENNK